MAIRKKLIAGVRVSASTSTHNRNLGPAPRLEVDDTTLKNHDDQYKLYDPDELEGGSAHKPNLEAAVDDNLPNDSINVSTIDNDIDPAEGYLPNALEEGADTDELVDPGAPQGLLEANEDGELETLVESPIVGSDEDDDEDDEDEEEEDWDDEPQPEDFDLEGDEVDEDEEVEEEVEAEADIEELPVGAAETMDLVDIDEVSENDTEDLVFASVGSKVLVLKNDRVIASMGRKQAVRAAVGDIYQSEPFHEAAFQEAKRHGLRAGLKSMGFVMAKVNVASSTVLEKRVEARVSAVTAAVRRNADNRTKSFGQCLAIASVGVSRRFFKDGSNVLQNTLIANLQRAGVRDAQKIVLSAFAQHGVEYAKSIMTIAQKLADMPEEHRSQFAEALDMLDEDGEFVESDVVLEDEDTSDFVDADLGDDFESELEEDFVPESITAALARPGRVSRGALLQRTGNLTASAILESSEPLQFM